jgi:L-histidine N-alpha-methyltransferase
MTFTLSLERARRKPPFRHPNALELRAKIIWEGAIIVQVSGERLRIDTRADHHTGSRLIEDARAGLAARQKWIPPVHFYDEEGSRLFDAICDTEEYYPTRTETALLEAVSDDVMRAANPRQLVELGSGTARKTRILLEAMSRVTGGHSFVPLDVSEQALRMSARELVDEYEWLDVHGVVGDYERTLALLPSGNRRLFAFLGSTIGNYDDETATRFLRSIRERFREGDSLLLGADLVKDADVLRAAYDDAAGLSAAFNRNMLSVLNRELKANFQLDAFEHVIKWNTIESQIEMHLRARTAQRVFVGDLQLEVAFAAGETLHTEISRKFTRPRVEALLAQAGFALREWYTPANDYFSLSLAVSD